MNYMRSVTIMTLLLIICGCNINFFPKDDPLVGTWKISKQVTTHDNGKTDTVTQSEYFSNTFTFNDDNTFTSSTILLGIPILLSGTWSTNDSVLSISVKGTETQLWTYSIDESKLEMSRSEPEGSGNRIIVEYYDKQ